MIRGTTPQNTFIIPFMASDLDKIYITYAQDNKVILEKTEKDVSIDSNRITVHLTQEDTLAFKAKTSVEIQLRGLIGTEAVASRIIKTNIDRILKDGVIK